MTALLALVLVLFLNVGTSILVMTYGWGLQIKSWWWVIGGGVFVQMVIVTLLDKIKKETGIGK